MLVAERRIRRAGGVSAERDNVPFHGHGCFPYVAKIARAMTACTDLAGKSRPVSFSLN